MANGSVFARHQHYYYHPGKLKFVLALVMLLLLLQLLATDWWDPAVKEDDPTIAFILLYVSQYPCPYLRPLSFQEYLCRRSRRVGT